jgi:hypothetical protein
MVDMAHVPAAAARRSFVRRPAVLLGSVVLATATLGSIGAVAMAATPASPSTDPAPLITAAVAVATQARTPAAPSAPAAAAGGHRVAVVGDSLIFTTAPEQQGELSRRGYDASVQGNPGKPLADPWIQARLGETSGRDIVVMATASNDNVQLAKRSAEVGPVQAADEYATTLAGAMARVDVPCTVVVDVRTESSALYHPETAPTTNDRLRQVAAARTTVVVPWSQLSAGHDQHDWFVGDELHFINGSQRQDAGVRAYTQAIANGVDQCAALLDAK